MGFFSGLDVESYDRQYDDRQLVKRIADYFSPYNTQLIIVTSLLLVIASAGAATPLLIAKGFDALGGDISITEILIICGSVLAAGIIVWTANYYRRKFVVRIVGDIVYKLRVDSFKSSVGHDLSFFDEYSSGKIVSRITSDTQEFGQTVVLITDLFSQIIQALILGVILIVINLRLSLFLFAFLPILFITALGFRRLARYVTRRGMRAMANVNSAIKETVSGIIVAKNFRQEFRIYEEFDVINKQSYSVNVQRGLVLSSVFPVLNVLGGIATASLLYIGGISAVTGLVTAGAWFLFLQSLDLFFFPVLNLSAFWAQVQSGLSATERVFALIDAESRVHQIDSIPVQDLRGGVAFINLDFRYSEKDIVLEGFNLNIKPGETIALVGHTGAGKSSIAKLIARFYEFQDGELLIDGVDIRKLNLREYRSQLGIVSQIPFLFSGSVLENICYACPGVDVIEYVNLISQKIGGGQWLESLPKGLETEVGERGSLLSMGQRQLVALLRVLVQKPGIFILDEATASIDPFTEWQIQQALNLILKDTTSVIIAHRLSTVRAADRIIVLENGVIIEEGNHEKLLESGGAYASLYNTYFRHQSLAYIEEIKNLAVNS
ncbi:MAG: ABC transporter ATP-binding protein [Anaerolineales bacterium]|jgi:ATP-binding cassette subfamily B protein